MKTIKAGLVITLWMLSVISHADPSGITLRILDAFNTNNGANPYDPPTMGADGLLYGTSPYGGTNAAGTIFKVTTNGSPSVLHVFDTWDGLYPVGQLLAARDGNLYGTASNGGTNSVGTIFMITTNGAFTLLYSFGMITNNDGTALDGSYPYGGLTQGKDGNFYGTTYAGGSNNLGTVYQFSATNDTLTTIYSFTSTNGTAGGAYPYTESLVEGAEGVFYGTTSVGGTNGSGTIFKVTSTGDYSTLYQFTQTNSPFAGLSFGSDGYLYGTTVYGGTHNVGVAFRVSTNGDFTTLYQFGGSENLSYPEGGVIPGINNLLYGTAYYGGSSGYGALFQLTTNGHLTVIYTFTGGTNGADPYAGVIRDSAGALYGTTLYGGNGGGYGTVFRWSDNTSPTVSVVTPTKNQRWTNALFTATGKASDNVGVADVYYSVNDSAWTTAMSTNGGTNWTAQFTLNPGTNLIQAYATDYSGRISATTNVNFDFVVTNQLTIQSVGKGTISPNYSNAWLEVGRNYSVTASAGSGFVFTNWTVSTNWVGGATTNHSMLQFMMASNLTLAVTYVDTSKPTLTISSPTSGMKMTNALATVIGTTTDNWGVTAVRYQLNHGDWMMANTTNSYTNWTSPLLTLVAGTNSVSAYALDLGGNFSTTNTVSFVSSNTFKLLLDFSAAQPLTGNGLDFGLQISPGLYGHIQVSSNLESWQTLTNFVGTNTVLNVHDPAAGNFKQRFYRAVIP